LLKPYYVIFLPNFQSLKKSICGPPEMEKLNDNLKNDGNYSTGDYLEQGNVSGVGSGMESRVALVVSILYPVRTKE
jgi:hypothetical protein